tara:strand:+ start:143 stop:475 length:333 start_codon:yes stop_codon:yes gene_type:complete
MEDIMKGKVKFFNVSKRFGFIAGDDGKEYFVHQMGLKEGVRINEDDTVVFDTEDGDRGPKAVNVALDDGSSSDSGADEAAPAESEDEAGSEEEAESEDSADESEEESKDE